MQLLKIFLAIIFIQIVTVSLVLLFPPDLTVLGISRLAVPLFFIALMASFWFSSLFSYFNKDIENKIKRKFEKEKEKIKQEFANEREKIKVNAEKEKIKVLKEAQKDITNEVSKTHAKANFKVGLSIAGVIGVGGLFIFAQMITAGLLALTTAGGALGGYYYRGRRIENKKRLEELEIIDAKVIEHKKK